MVSSRESIQADPETNFEIELIKNDEIENLLKRNLFLISYLLLILLINAIVFFSNQITSSNDRFLIGGMMNIAIAGISIYYYWVGLDMNEDSMLYQDPGGMLEHKATVDFETNPNMNNTPSNANFKILIPSSTIYLFLVPMLIGILLIILGLFIV